MSRNGSGVYSLPAGNPVVTGATISSSWANTTLSDIATALTGSVAADGQTAMTGNLQMGNNKITGLAAGTASGDALSFGQAATISALTVSGLTAGRVVYTSTGGLLASSANLLYSGTDLTVYGLTVGRGAGAGASNTAVGNLALRDNTTGNNNAAFGLYALVQNTSGNTNTAFGSNSLYSNTTASYNTAVGYQAGYSNTTGGSSTWMGYRAGYAGVTATGVTAFGFNSLTANTATGNSAFGAQTLLANTSGTNNSAFGGNDFASYQPTLGNNTTGNNNSAFGHGALGSNTTASNNTAVGYQAGYSNTTGVGFTAIGRQAGYSNTAGNYNTYIGEQAGYSNTVGAGNIFIGEYSGFNTTGQANTFIGCTSAGYGSGYLVTTGSKNTILGAYSGNQGGLDIRTANNVIVLSDGDGNPRAWFESAGKFVKGGDSGNARLVPATDNAGYVGEDVRRWQAIYAVNGTIQTSDGREKNTIVDSDLGLDFISTLRPVSYKWNIGENVVTYDEDGNEIVTPRAGVRTHYGLIAQEVKEAIPEGVDFGGFVQEPNNGMMSLRYHEFLSPMIKAIQELKAEVDSLKQQLNGV